MTLNSAQLSATKLSFSFNSYEKDLFSDLSFNLHPGQILHIRGQNGSGKTTLLKILAGILKTYSGQFFQSPELENQDIFYLSHQNPLYPHFTAKENISVMMAHLKMTAPQTILHHILTILDLDSFENVPIKKLSFGQQKKLCFAPLYLKPYKLWILDEPLTGLDASFLEKFKVIINAHLKAKRSIILTSHDDIAQKLGLDFQIQEMHLKGGDF